MTTGVALPTVKEFGEIDEIVDRCSGSGTIVGLSTTVIAKVAVALGAVALDAEII